MARTLVVAGERSNLLARGKLTASSEDPDFPLPYACDGRGGSPFRFASAGVDDFIQGDLDEVKDGGFEGGLAEWTKDVHGAGNDVLPETTIVNPGGSTKSTRLILATAGSGNYASASQVLARIPTGERRVLAAALYAGGVTGRLRVYCPETNGWLRPDGTWGSAVVDVFTEGAAAWVRPTPVVFTTPTFAEARRLFVTLRLIAIAAEPSATGLACIDDVACWASSSLLMIHGHDLGPVSVEWRASEDGFALSNTLVATIPIRPRSFYAALSTPLDARFVRIRFVGKNHEPVWMGEVVLGQALSLEQRPLWGIGGTERLPQIRVEGPLGVAGVYALGNETQRSRTLPWTWTSAAKREEFMSEVARRSGFGRWPVVFVTMDSEPDVIFGHLPDETADERVFLTRWQANGITITEAAFPSWM